MAKKYKTVLSLLLVVLVVVSVVTITGVLDINKIIKEHETGKANETKTSYSDVFFTDTSCADRLMKTDIENIFYTMTPAGEVSFYEIADGKLTEVEETGTMDFEAPCSGQKLPATVHYIEKDGKTTGVGLFTNEMHPEVFLYDYAFFKLTDMYPAYDSRSKLLLMIDIDKNRFYSDDKIFSENFRVFPSGKIEHFLSENQRTVGGNAMMRSDYKMFTSDILSQTDENTVLFFSSRYYTAIEDSGRLDILTSGGGGENVDNLSYIKDIASFNFWRTDKGTKYFALIENGFALMNYISKDKTETVMTFAGNLKEDYITDGSMILNIESGDIYDVLTEKSYKLDYNKFKMNFTPDLFTVSENGKYCMVRGANNLRKPAIGIYDFEKDEFYTYNDNIFGYVSSMYVLNDGSVVLSVSNNESGTSHSQLIGIAGQKLNSEETTQAE